MIFASNTGKVLDGSNVRKSLIHTKEKMKVMVYEEKGIPIEEVVLTNFTPHSLRHTFATRALEKDIHIKVVADWLGHSTIRITGDTYSHVSSSKRKSSIERLKGIIT